MTQMLRIGNILHDPTQLNQVEIRDNGEIVVRMHNSTIPIVLKGEEAKDFLSQLESATIQRDKVTGLKEEVEEKAAANKA